MRQILAVYSADPPRRFALRRLLYSVALAVASSALGAAAGGFGAAIAVMLSYLLVSRRWATLIAAELGGIVGWLGPDPSEGRWLLVGLGALSLALLAGIREWRGRDVGPEARGWALMGGLVAVGVANYLPFGDALPATAWLVLCGWLLASALGVLTEGFAPLERTTLAPDSFKDRALGRGSATRNLVAAALATGVDFAVFHTLLAWLSPPAATLIGCLVGGVVNFTINWRWAFDSSGSLSGAAMRYVWVSGASAALNSGAMALALLDPSVSPVAAWIVARALGSLGWNYPMQRDHVFAHARTR